jgi:Homeodomain-like domain-containing protein
MSTALEQSYYSVDERERAVVLYLIHGNPRRVSELCGIPQRTLQDWIHRSEWWRDSIARIRAELQDELDARLTQILNVAVNQVIDRLENGDEVYVDGQPVRKKITGRDAAVIAAIAFDKRQILRHEPTAIRSSDSHAARMRRLADNMRQALKGRVIDPNDPKQPNDPNDSAS